MARADRDAREVFPLTDARTIGPQLKEDLCQPRPQTDNVGDLENADYNNADAVPMPLFHHHASGPFAGLAPDHLYSLLKHKHSLPQLHSRLLHTPTGINPPV